MPGPPQHWFDGVYLVGQYNWFRTGVWLLAHGGEAAVLELPPASISGLPWGPSPDDDALAAAQSLGVSVKYLLCTHAHLDHFSRDTLAAMQRRFPAAETVLQAGFRTKLGRSGGVRYFEEEARLSLGGEALFLVHAPKHSPTDTMVIFRGSACTGDWELGTSRTVNDSVPLDTRLRSCERVIAFVGREDYRVHRVYSVHANDRREGVDFPALLASTREDRQLW